MKTKAPAARRRFTDQWDEVSYLYDKLLYWLYKRADTEKARTFARRLEYLLSRTAADPEAVFAQECWSLVYEARGDLPKAIEHRVKEIRLIRQLHELADGPADRALILKQYGYDDLSDRLDLLAVLYHDSGNLENAIKTLQESKRLCKSHRLRFDGQDILEEYQAERRNRHQLHRAPAARGA